MTVIATIEQLEAIYGYPNDASTVKVADRITAPYRVLIEKSPFAALATSGPEGVALSVTDTGAGIAAEHVGKIFEPLFTTKPRGIGLGLAVARSLSESNGATLTVESAPGRGSRFVMRFA